ncbi:MAG: hypothetical protein QOE56_1001 [Solirubrobacterales bacterium]|jgi:hypothetical protein|nr:hypothetical protein [Solirubrobacterales bacterium]
MALRSSQRRSSAYPLVAAVLALACVGLLRAERAEAKLPPLNTGVSYVYGNEPLEFQHVLATGANMALVPLRWADVAPPKPPANWDAASPADPNYDWAFYDTWVKNAVAAGLTPILQVRGAPSWAQECPTPFPPDSPCKPSPPLLESFAKAAASRYSGSFGGLPRVVYFQGLNEPNLYAFFNPQYEGNSLVSPTLYRRLINSFYNGIKSVMPSDFVIAAGLGPVEIPNIAVGPMKFARAMLCMTGRAHPHKIKGSNCEGGVHFDAFDIHPYTSGGPTHEGGPDEVQLGDIPKLQALLKAADDAGRIKSNLHKRTPLWITELSWDSKPPDPGGLPMAIEKQWIAEALYRSWKAGVRNFFWFSLVDFQPEGLPFPASIQAGLYFWAPKVADQRPKPIINAFRFPFVAFPKASGLLIWGRNGVYKGGKVAIQAKRDGKWRTLKVVRADGNGLFSATLSSHYGRDKKGSVRARYAGETSIPFPMKPVGDFFHRPFG